MIKLFVAASLDIKIWLFSLEESIWYLLSLAFLAGYRYYVTDIAGFQEHPAII